MNLTHRHTVKIFVLYGFNVLLFVTVLHVGLQGYRIYNYMENGNNMAKKTMPYSQNGSGEQTILILGDSLAYGVGTSSPEKSFAGLIGARFPDATVTNKAVIGEDISGLAKSMHKLVDRKYDKIFVIIGGNDIAHYAIDIDESVNELATINKMASAHADHAYMYTSIDFTNVSAVPNVIDNYFSNRSLLLRNESKRLAATYHNVTYVDAYDVPPDTYKTLEASDGFHLNDRGIRTLVDITFDD